MIKSFVHKGLYKFYSNGSTAGIQAKDSTRLRAILSYLNEAEDITDMNLPGLKLHKLKGLSKDLWAVSVNGNWRVTFKFEEGNAYIVDYLDYH